MVRLTMNKYFQVGKTSLKQEIAYPINFIMWRLRNVIQIFLVYFLWDSVFTDPKRVLFGYSRESILTYVFGIMLVRAFVLSSKSMDLAGEIARGDLSNYLIRPVNYFFYWLSRDLASKALNLTFVVGEFSLLFLILKPSFFVQSNIFYIVSFIFSVFIGILIYTLCLFIVSSVAFWMPEMAWGAHFLVSIILVEFLSGVIFPLDLFPVTIQKALSFLPFPYLVFFPLQIYLGKPTVFGLARGFVVEIFWLGALALFLDYIWKKGLKTYESYGK